MFLDCSSYRYSMLRFDNVVLNEYYYYYYHLNSKISKIQIEIIL